MPLGDAKQPYLTAPWALLMSKGGVPYLRVCMLTSATGALTSRPPTGSALGARQLQPSLRDAQVLHAAKRYRQLHRLPHTQAPQALFVSRAA